MEEFKSEKGQPPGAKRANARVAKPAFSRVRTSTPSAKRPGGWAWRTSPDVPCRHSWLHVCAVQVPPAGHPAKTRPDSRGASTPTAAPFRVGRCPGLQAHRPPPPPEAHRPTRARHENHTNPHGKPYFLTRNLPSGRRPLEAKPLKTKHYPFPSKTERPNQANLAETLPNCARSCHFVPFVKKL